MPVPMMAPMPSAIRFIGPSTRRRPWLVGRFGSERWIGFVRKSDMAQAYRDADAPSAIQRPSAKRVGGRRRAEVARVTRPTRNESAEPIRVVRRSRSRAVGETAAKRVDVTRGEIRELGALGVRRTDARADRRRRGGRPPPSRRSATSATHVSASGAPVPQRDMAAVRRRRSAAELDAAALPARARDRAPRPRSRVAASLRRERPLPTARAGGNRASSTSGNARSKSDATAGTTRSRAPALSMTSRGSNPASSRSRPNVAE